MTPKLCENIDVHRTWRRMFACRDSTCADLSYSGFYIIPIVLVSTPSLIIRRNTYFLQDSAIVMDSWIVLPLFFWRDLWELVAESLRVCMGSLWRFVLQIWHCKSCCGSWCGQVVCNEWKRQGEALETKIISIFLKSINILWGLDDHVVESWLAVSRKVYVYQTKQILALAGPQSDKLHPDTFRSFYSYHVMDISKIH